MMHTSQLCREKMVGWSALVALPQLASKYFADAPLLLVADDHTFAAAGHRVRDLLPMHRLTIHSLGVRAKASITHVEAIMAMITAEKISGILAVGSGTVNDICKLAAARCNIPYIAIATAASMNGYTSGAASIIIEGWKSSLAALPPVAVIADLEIITVAPRRLARSGLGDTLCRSTVEADMLLSHHLLGTPYPEECFTALRRHEPALIAGAEKLREGSAEYIELLMHALLDAGDWMTRTGSSAIASQGEHMLAHTLEMLYGDEIRALHGEVIAVTTTTMHYLQHKMLLGQPQVRPLVRDDTQYQRIFGKHVRVELAALYNKKFLTPEKSAAINQRLQTEWPAIRQSLEAIMAQGSAIERAFLHANVGCIPRDIGVSDERYESALTHAYLTRDRFTFLDLAVMMGRRA